MNIFIYIMIFIAGTVFGSFFSLAVYRIPRKENITYVQSHCVKCNHKLGPLDLIPIWSYVFLRGRCRYCGEKIRSRYVLLELTSGITFVLVALALNIGVYSSLIEFIKLFLIYLYMVAIFVIGGIDKENNSIPDNMILYSIVIGIMKLIYNAYVGSSLLPNMIGFLLIPLILVIMNIIYKKKKGKDIVRMDLIKYVASIGLFVGFDVQLVTIVIAEIVSLFGKLIHKKEKVPFGYYISIAFVLLFPLKIIMLFVALSQMHRECWGWLLKVKSQKGFSLIEIGIALVLSGIFTVSCITLLSASNENYRMIEQRSIALSYAMKAIEASLLSDVGINIDDIQKKALVENNMQVTVDLEDVLSEDGNKKLQIVTANVTYHIKSNVAGGEKTLTLKTLNVD